jgi:hypothetical protein
MLYRAMIFGTVVAHMGGVAASAQSDPRHMLYLAVANQLGVLEYCRSYGWVDDATVDAERKIAAVLPASSDSSGLSDAENDGRQGTLVVNGNKVRLAGAVSSGGPMAQIVCTELGSTARAVATNLRDASNGSDAPVALR